MLKVCYMCVLCAEVLKQHCTLNVGLHQRGSSFSLFSFWDQSNRDISHIHTQTHTQASARLSFLFRKFSVSGQHFLLHMVCYFHGARSLPKSLA